MTQTAQSAAGYLEESAEQLRKIAAILDHKTEERSWPLARIAHERRLVAEGFHTIAAIEQGLVPTSMMADVLVRVAQAGAAQ
jgi:hypothetical protein